MNWKAPGPRERGAVAVLTAIIVMFVAVGMLALSVDLGRITYDRAKLQNGADAGALAIAANCAAKAPTGCSSTPSTQIQQLVNDNASASDGAQDLSDAGRPAGKPPICFGNSTVTPACPVGSMTSLSDCVRLPDWIKNNNVPYVEVRTRTKTSSGTILPAIFGPSPGTTQITCSRAAWAAAGSTGATLPVTMSICNWSQATADGAKYAPPPEYVPAPSSSKPTVPTAVAAYVTAITTHKKTGNSPTTCTSAPGKNYPPGGFGFLDGSSNCQATIAVGTTVTGDGDNGASVPTSCKDLLDTYLGKVVAVPIYNSYSGSGSGGTYQIAGISMFYFAGYVNLPSAGVPGSKKDNSVYAKPAGACSGCANSDNYLWGWFTTGLLPVTATQGQPGDNFGATQIYPAG